MGLHTQAPKMFAFGISIGTPCRSFREFCNIFFSTPSNHLAHTAEADSPPDGLPAQFRYP